MPVKLLGLSTREKSAHIGWVFPDPNKTYFEQSELNPSQLMILLPVNHTLNLYMYY